ncbi:MAG: hypothetical protein O2955_14865 [Planctomycetota bacterium]|nr:hypothetical protein [Planctomycetota bacterium]MDA1213795.1 hypothetical protein [Planctomycetota bacterium]
MQIGGLGGIGSGGFNLGGISFGGAAGINGTMSASIGGGTAGLDQAGMAGGLSPQMNQLIELMQGMNTAQILMALMLASGGKDDDKKGGGSDAAMAFLAGMAIASQMNQMPMSLQMNCGDTGGGGIEGISGGMLNTLA